MQSVFELALESQGPERTAQLLEKLATQLRSAPRPSAGQTTPYVNTIPADQQPAYPGDRAIERRIKSMMRWNAMAMVVKANSNTNVGGHIASFASSATLYEVAQNHFFRGAHGGFSGRQVYFRPRRAGHVCARLSRRPVGRIAPAKFPAGTAPKAAGLSSYPHPYLMPEFWQFPDGLDGPWPDHVAVSGAVQPLPAGARSDELERRSRKSGRFSATANPTSPNRSAPSRSRRARTSTTSSGW